MSDPTLVWGGVFTAVAAAVGLIARTVTTLRQTSRRFDRFFDDFNSGGRAGTGDQPGSMAERLDAIEERLDEIERELHPGKKGRQARRRRDEDLPPWR